MVVIQRYDDRSFSVKWDSAENAYAWSIAIFGWKLYYISHILNERGREVWCLRDDGDVSRLAMLGGRFVGSEID